MVHFECRVTSSGLDMYLAKGYKAESRFAVKYDFLSQSASWHYLVLVANC